MDNQKNTYVALYTVGVEIKATTLEEAEKVAKDFRRSIGIGDGPCYPKGIPIAVQDDTLTVVYLRKYLKS